jgi:putative methanogenesis marker protein 17
MEIEVLAEDKFGGESYRVLFEEIMSDIGKAVMIERSLLVLKPEIPLFVFSVRLRAEPSNKTIADAANIRTEGGMLHLSISDERYAPDILRELWTRYGKESVNQQTRLDIEVSGAPEEDVKSIVIASEEEHLKEIVGSIWRSLPEGIKNRHTFIDGQVITVAATEEIFQPHMLKEGEEHHKRMMEGAKDV